MAQTTATNIGTYPALCMRGVVAFPKMGLSLDLGRKKSINAVKAAMEKDEYLFLVTQKNILAEEPTADELYEIGCLCKVRQMLKVGEEGAKILVECFYRAKRLTFADNGKYCFSTVERLYDAPVKNRPVYIESVTRKVKHEFEKYLSVGPKIPADIIMGIAAAKDLSYLCDFIAYNIPAPFDDKQYVLEQLNPVNRGKIVTELLIKEREITDIDNRISEQTKIRMDDNQRDYYLKEQMRVISDELYGDGGADEVEEYYKRLEKLNAKDEVKQKIKTEIVKLQKMPQGAHESTVQRNFLDLALSLPWNKRTNARVNIKRAAKILDRDFYGLKKVKDRILEMLSVFALSPDISGQIICLVGPPGVGKTSIGKVIAECMGRKYARVSLGGMHDEAEIRGHRKTYIGAMPGRIISALKSAGTSDPLILLDEIDKLGSDYKGDPASALLEVLDGEQNKAFYDNFLEIPYDLSHVVFVTTANSADTIPAPLLDRMDVIYLEGYTREEKFNIAKRHLVSREMASHALKPSDFRITDKALYTIVDNYTREAGVRKLSRVIGSLCAKAARKIAEGETQKVIVKDTDLVSMLGAKKYKPEAILPEDNIGIINGLAWTAVGGEIMQMEVVSAEGTGKIELTGSLGDVMKESAKAAVTYVRANADKYDVDPDFYKTRDIHIHATEAAVSKDGPSAGITMATALVSALTDRPVLRDVAMTGEITIRGRVTAIGGLKEKLMAAYRGGVKTVFIPRDNLPDLDEVDDIIKDNIKIIPVSRAEEVILSALKAKDETAAKAPEQTHSKINYSKAAPTATISQ